MILIPLEIWPQSNLIMIASILTMLPSLISSLFFIAITWIICKLWYNSRYIHRSEVKPLQESQQIMQNQYAILAERIKHTDNLLNETKIKLENAIRERDEAMAKKQAMELLLENGPAQPDAATLRSELIAELKDLLALRETPAEEENKTAGKEQVNFIRQNLKEFRAELTQKFNISTNQYHELSNQLWQLLELNKKLNAEAEQITKLLSNNTEGTDDDTKLSERPFTLASIKKRS